DMATVYATIAGGGLVSPPTVLIEVSDVEGTFSHREVASRSRVLDSALAVQVTGVLRSVVADGTGRRAQVPGVDVAGKTGTSQENRDAWFVGFSPRFTAAVWMGYPDDGRPMLDVLGVAAVTGGSFPATIFSEVMTALHVAEVVVEDTSDEGSTP
ncbi:MAG: penicillin-binding transpeptidase domain-containing protein, partial [Actinomycetota bacterium]|nr:penicillin-binding transpeptidase domain-containing protein [Actinomycetota bacterium]